MTPTGARDKLTRCNALRELSMSIVENAVREIDEQGFTNLPNLLSAVEVDEIVDGIRSLDEPTTHDIISRTRVAVCSAILSRIRWGGRSSRWAQVME